MGHPLSLSVLLFGLASTSVHAYEVYRPQNPQVIFGPSSAVATSTATAGAAAYTGSAAYNPITLTAPAPPNPPINTNFGIQLFSGGMTNMSIPLPSAFFGFSIEMSVATQVLGRNSSAINVPFLNLLANIVERAGSVNVRVGGNTQEAAELKDSLPNNTILSKDYTNIANSQGTPPIQYTPDLLYMMNNISTLTNAHWYMGIPFYSTTPIDFALAETAQAILGDRLLALQAGNEPDLYAANGRTHRPQGYAPSNYFGEIGDLIGQASSQSNLPRQNDLWLVPSVSSVQSDTAWNPDAVWATGIVDAYLNSLHALTIERYPANNCAAVFNTGNPIVNPQDILESGYLNHGAPTQLYSEYISTAAIAVAHNKPLIMFETNTASCSGFGGISDAFVASLWGLDWALTLAAGNFSGAMFHVGGQSAFYNPFTPPPTNQTSFRQWSIGPIYYSALVMSEVMGNKNLSQVVDLFANNNQEKTPAYAIYENGVPVKVALFNYIDDPSQAQAYTASISIGGGTTGQSAANPTSVRVKRLLASSVTQKGNFTWAGQTFGNHFESDGRIMGNLDVETVQCDTTNNVCQVHVPAPGFALVFLTDDAYNAASPDPAATQTFPTTYLTATINTARVDASVLATSNGHGDLEGLEFTTSPGSRSGAAARWAMPGLVGLVGAAVGAVVVGRRMW